MQIATKQNIVDILVTECSENTFLQQVCELGLSAELQNKCIEADRALTSEDISAKHLYLTKEDEGELATEVLLTRHRFTQLVAKNVVFRQAALTIIQNIYISKERKIFFGTSFDIAEKERQVGLNLFSQPADSVSVPLEKTFQHLIIARVWERILYKANPELIDSKAFAQLRGVVQRLNTARNIYILLTTRLVAKITSQLQKTYQQSINHRDACQIASFGVARAAYRYHPSIGVRFSTYASKWIQREVQLQALSGRLIKVPASLLERLSKASRKGNKEEEQQAVGTLANATVALSSEEDILIQPYLSSADPADSAEQKQLAGILMRIVNSVLPEKSADIVKRRYGLKPYGGQPQSMVEISKLYGVSRGSIYQLEKKALRQLRNHLRSKEIA
ncbi:sigma-70 family RNA polymerase sigma factor [Desulfogranum marinum]|uniref:sigma-70 family RNA polymerase sigma factor n=1 Tax=Desulfogranum marinum TaxID=453220 RepID=UPI0019651C9E|nr:sigma-70 family RNA polymerase sigma factor [Desulfogranum marinum]MBM9514845.1 sigma-70 family RNA polymerase sigma factor [Desulfogranum marinum]